MKSISILAAAVIVMVASAFTLEINSGSYKATAESTTIEWLGKKVTGEHTGNISLKSADLEVKNGKLVSGSVIIDMNTITCTDLTDESYNQKLVGHLKSDDFFGVEKFPTSKLNIAKVKAKGGNEYELTGDITIKETTQAITFPATITVDGDKLTAKADVVIDRAKFDIRYGSGSFFDGLGDKMIYDDFELKINLTASL